MDYTELSDGEVLDEIWRLLTKDNATPEQLISFLKQTGF